MKKMLFRNTLRSVKNTKSRFIAIMAIIAIGSGFFAGVKSAGPDMKLSAADYLHKQALDDFHIVSELGMDDEDVAAAEKLGITDEIYAGYSADLMLSALDGAEKIIKVYSYNPDSGISKPYITEGRLPEKAGEIFIDEKLFSSAVSEMGGTMSFHTGDDRALEDMLNASGYTVVGKGLLPRYVSFERGTTSIGNGSIDGWALIPEENFTYEVYTDMYLSIVEADGVDPYSEEYEDIISRNTDILEAFAETQIEHRKSVITDEAYEEINDAKAELEDGKKELADAEKKIEDGKKELADAEKELADGKQEIADAEAEIEDAKEQLVDGEKEIEDGKKELADAEKELADGKKEIADAEKELADGRKELADAEKEIADGKAEIAKAEKEIADGKKKLADGEKKYNDGVAARDNLKDVVAQLEKVISDYGTKTADINAVNNTVKSLVENGVFTVDDTLKQLLQGYMMMPAQYDDGTKTASKQGIEMYITQLEAEITKADEALKPAYEELEKARKELADGEAELEKAKKELADGEAELEKGKKELADGEAELEKGRKELADGEAKFEDAKQKIADAEAEIADAKQKIADGEKELADGKTELSDGEKEIADAKQEIADGEQELADAKTEIADAEKEIADAENELAEEIDGAEMYVFDRKMYPAYANYAEDCERVDAIAAVFPIFFILVAALVCCTTMTRMVEEQRTQIGTLKALGYSRFSIIGQYIIYALAASIPGTLIGLLIGFNTIPAIIYECYHAMYNQPYIIAPFRWDYAIGCAVAACLCTGLSALFASRQELVSVPAQLMRPKPPKEGKRILLERITFIWKRLKFTTKVTFRNLFRYKARLLMTVIGIAGCTALLLTGYGLQYSVTSIVDKQYGEVFKYNSLVALDTNADDEAYASVAQDSVDTGIVSEQLFALQETHDVANADGEDVETYILVPENYAELSKFIDLHSRETGESFSLDESGVIIGEKISRMLDVHAGDEIHFNDGHNLRVAAVCENYTFNYVFMSRADYEKAGFDDEFRSNIILQNMSDLTKEDELSTKLVGNDTVLTIQFSSNGGDKFRDLVSSLSMIIVVVIVAAGALAFVVLFNLSDININERVRELATIKVLGFYDGEVAAYVYRENVLLTVMGTAAGLILGIFLEKFVVHTAEVDSVMFAPEIPLYCFLAAAALTVLFAVIVNITLYFRLKKIDMATSLKAIE